MTSSSATHAGPASTSASRPSARKPTAKCAIGEIRIDDRVGGCGRTVAKLTPPSVRH